MFRNKIISAQTRAVVLGGFLFHLSRTPPNPFCSLNTTALLFSDPFVVVCFETDTIIDMSQTEMPDVDVAFLVTPLLVIKYQVTNPLLCLE